MAKRKKSNRKSVCRINLSKNKVWNKRIKQVLRKGKKRFQKEKKRFTKLGIIDNKGNPLRKDLPPDMRP